MERLNQRLKQSYRTITVGCALALVFLAAGGRADQAPAAYSCSPKIFSSTVTWYDNSTDGLSACHYSDPTLPGGTTEATQFYSAAATHLYDDNICGACAQITDVSGGPGNGKQVIVQITDECPAASNPTNCYTGSNHLDLSEHAFTQMENSTVGVFNVQWHVIPCPNNYMNTLGQNGANLVYQFKSGASSGWATLLIRDYTMPISTVEYCTGLGSGCGQASWQESYNGWTAPSGSWSTIYLRITDKGGNQKNFGPINCCSPMGTDSKTDPATVWGNVTGGQMPGCTSGTMTFTPSDTPSPKPSATLTFTLTHTPLPTSTATPTDTPTKTMVPSVTFSPTRTATLTVTDSFSPSVSPTDTLTFTDSPTRTGTRTATETATPLQSLTDTQTHTPGNTDTPSFSPTATRTSTQVAVPTGTATSSPLPSALPSDTSTTLPTAGATDTPVQTATTVPTTAPSNTTVPTVVPSATSVNTVAPTATAVPTLVPSSTTVPTVDPSATSANTVGPTATTVPTTAPSSTAVPTAVPSATSVNTVAPTATAVPTTVPSSTPDPSATNGTTAAPSATMVPTTVPSNTPVPTTDSSATAAPTSAGSATAVPTGGSTSVPTATAAPTGGATPTPGTTNGGTPEATPTTVPGTETVPPPGGVLHIVEVRAIPNPVVRAGGKLFLNMEGQADSVSVKIYSKSLEAVGGPMEYGPAGPGWVGLALPDYLAGGASNGIYYLVVTAQRGGATASTPSVCKVMVLH